MAHIPDDDDFMNASAEGWSKPEPPPPTPDKNNEPTDRWGAPIPDPSGSADTSRWGSESVGPTRSEYQPPAKKGGSKWWIILIVIAVLICLCVCLVLVGLPLLGVNLLQNNAIQF